MSSPRGDMGSTMGSTRTTLPTSAKGEPLASKNLSAVAYEAARVGLAHAELKTLAAIDGRHLAQAADELRETREQIKVAALRMARNQRAIDGYEADCAPLMRAYDLSVEGFRKTYEHLQEGHEKCAWAARTRARACALQLAHQVSTPLNPAQASAFLKRSRSSRTTCATARRARPSFGACPFPQSRSSNMRARALPPPPITVCR